MTYSKKLNSTLRNRIRLLSNQAEIGVHTDILNIRNLKVGNFSIFYQIKPETIEKIYHLLDNSPNIITIMEILLNDPYFDEYK